MGRWKLCFVLLLQLTFYIDSTATLVKLSKTIGSKPDVTPICKNETLNIITIVICKIRTQMRGEECRLMYQHGQDFIHECDSRFTLLAENRTMFLHLTSLTPEDSGNYTCECSRPDGTIILHLNITVEEDEDPSSTTGTEISLVNVGILIGVIIFIIITGVILLVIYSKIYHSRGQLEPQSSRPDVEPRNIEPYLTFIQRENALYSATAYINDSNVFTRI